MTVVSYKYNYTVTPVESTIIHCTVDGTRMNEKKLECIDSSVMLPIETGELERYKM